MERENCHYWKGGFERGIEGLGIIVGRDGCVEVGRLMGLGVGPKGLAIGFRMLVGR